jgi:amino acid permease
LFALKK